MPWYLMLLLGLWRTRWLIWIDRTLQFAPNPGFGKAVINLNTGAWAPLRHIHIQYTRPHHMHTHSVAVTSSPDSNRGATRSTQFVAIISQVLDTTTTRVFYRADRWCLIVARSLARSLAVWAALIGVLFLKGKMNLKQILGIAMSFGGAFSLVF